MKKLTFTLAPDQHYYNSEVLTSGEDGRIAFQFTQGEKNYDVGFMASVNGTDFIEVDLRVIRDSRIIVMTGLKPGMQVKLRSNINAEIYAQV